MARTIINDGEEIIFQDLVKISQNIDSDIYGKLLYRLFNKTYGFLQDSMFVDFQDATHISVRAGLGLQNDVSQVDPEPAVRPFYRATATTLTLATPDTVNPRIDIVVARADRVNTKTETRQFKDNITSIVSPVSMVTESDWQATLQIVAGTPAGSPVAPAVPSGYVKIAQLAVAANTGMASQSSITDSRILVPALDQTSIDTTAFVSVPTKALSVPLKTVLAQLDVLAKASYQLLGIYDAIVGSAFWCTHADLASAYAAIPVGGQIYVVENQVLNATLAMNKINTALRLKPGVTISKGTATIGIQASASGIEISGGRMSGFSVAGNKAIAFTAPATYGKVFQMRFANNDTDIDDSLVTVNQFGNISE